MFICTYQLNGLSKVTKADELQKLSQGFWADDSGNFCETSLKAELFILPHMIKEIRKVNDPPVTDPYEEN